MGIQAGSREAGRRGRSVPGEWLYGRNAVRESLRAGRRRFVELRVAAGVESSPAFSEILRSAQERGVPVRRVDRRQLDELVHGAGHQGVCLRSGHYPYVSLRDLLQEDEVPFLLALDSLQDPQNLGTLIRTAEAFGVTGVVIPERRAAGITPAVVNASAGAVEHLRVAQVTNLARSLDQMKERGIWAVGLEARPDAISLRDVKLDGAVAVVVGSEGEGIRRLVLEKCDVVARLPLLGKVESLNAAVAGSIALYELSSHRAV